MITKPRLSERRHTLRRLPRHHTSYALLAFLIGLSVVALLGVGFLVRADQVTVTAAVPGPPPATAATITRPVNGEVFTAAPTMVEGTCYNLYFISIYRNGTFAGSTRCRVDDTFGLQIDLVPGQNVLIARIIDFNNQAGPDSSPVTVTFTPPTGVNPVLPSATAPLLLGIAPPFASLSEGEEGEWVIELSGGRAPFAIRIDWGDGTDILISQAGREKIRRSHRWSKAGGYQMTVTASDSAGQSRFIKVSVFVGEATPVAGGTKPLIGTPSFMIAWWLFPLLLLCIISFWLGERYELYRLDFRRVRRRR